MKVRKFEDLEVWQIARDLSVEIYRATQDGKFSRDFGLRDQIRRAAVSVMSNIAEGFDRYSRAEFKQFLSIARGSASRCGASYTWPWRSATSHRSNSIT